VKVAAISPAYRGIGHAYIKPATPQAERQVERPHRVDDEEFHRMLGCVVIDFFPSAVTVAEPIERVTSTSLNEKARISRGDADSSGVGDGAEGMSSRCDQRFRRSGRLLAVTEVPSSNACFGRLLDLVLTGSHQDSLTATRELCCC
jgi:hypothetical protein